MGMPAKQAVEIRSFPGLATRPDSLDTPPGAAIAQENVTSNYDGQLRSRPGASKVTFEEE
jgi:hypothetical protein